MPTAQQVKTFLCLTVVPVAAGAAANWLMINVHALTAFHLTATSVAGELTQFGVFGVTAGIAWLSAHGVLKGVYPTSRPSDAGRAVSR